MKKLIIVMLVAVLASSFAFAALAGNVNIQFKGDFDNKEFGFANGTYAALSFTYKSDPINILGEEEVHVVLAVEGSVKVINKKGSGNGNLDLQFEGPFTYSVKFNEAKIAGSNWWVSILGAQGPADYAKASVLLNNAQDGMATYKASYAAAPGITASYADFVGSFGFWKGDTGLALSGTIETPEFKFAEDAVTVKFAAGGGKAAGAGKAVAGVSATSTVKVQDVTFSVAGDFGLENITKDFDVLKFAGDASVSGSYKFVSASAYVFATNGTAQMDNTDYNKLYLEASAGVDLNEFDVPVTVDVTAQNIVDKSNKPVTLGASAKYSKDAITASVSAGIDLKDGFAGWNASVSGEYKAEKFTVGGEVDLGGDKDKAFNQLSAGVYATTDALVNGATFGVSYGYEDVINLGGLTNNFLGEPKSYGQAGVYCVIGF